MSSMEQIVFWSCGLVSEPMFFCWIFELCEFQIDRYMYSSLLFKPLSELLTLQMKDYFATETVVGLME